MYQLIVQRSYFRISDSRILTSTRADCLWSLPVPGCAWPCWSFWV